MHGLRVRRTVRDRVAHGWVRVGAIGAALLALEGVDSPLLHPEPLIALHHHARADLDPPSRRDAAVQRRGEGRAGG
eukprot:236889-Rhodomonas_salina.1